MTIPISDRSATSSASATPSVSTGSIGSRYGTIKDLRLGSNNTDNFHLKVTSTLKSHKDDDEDIKQKKNESTPVPLEPMVRIEPPQMHSLFWFGSTANKNTKLQRSNSLGDVSKGSSMDWQDTMSPASADDTKRSRSHSLPSLMEMCSQIPINSPLTSTSPSTYSPNSAMSIVSSPSASSEDERSPDSTVSTSSPDSSSSPSHRMTYYRYSPYDSVTSRNTFVREMQGSKPQIRENNNNTTRDNRDDRYNHGRWTNEEHDQFVLGFQMCGRDWSRIAREYVPSRMRSQVASHAQKYLMKLESERPGGSSLQ